MLVLRTVCSLRGLRYPRGKREEEAIIAHPDQARQMHATRNRTELTSNNNPALAVALLLPRRREAYHWLGSAWLAYGACMSPSTVLSIYQDHVCSLSRNCDLSRCQHLVHCPKGLTVFIGD